MSTPRREFSIERRIVMALLSCLAASAGLKPGVGIKRE
jgi:hypothetical protein